VAERTRAAVLVLTTPHTSSLVVHEIPITGDILALRVYPTYDPQSFGDTQQNFALQNHAVSFPF